MPGSASNKTCRCLLLGVPDGRVGRPQAPLGVPLGVRQARCRARLQPRASQPRPWESMDNELAVRLFCIRVHVLITHTSAGIQPSLGMSVPCSYTAACQPAQRAQKLLSMLCLRTAGVRQQHGPSRAGMA